MTSVGVLSMDVILMGGNVKSFRNVNDERRGLFICGSVR